MQIDKQQILNLLRNAGDHDKAAQAEGGLPDQVDTEQHAGLLDTLGIDVSGLLGGGAVGGIAGKLGL